MVAPGYLLCAKLKPKPKPKPEPQPIDPGKQAIYFQYCGIADNVVGYGKWRRLIQLLRRILWSGCQEKVGACIMLCCILVPLLYVLTIGQLHRTQNTVVILRILLARRIPWDSGRVSFGIQVDGSPVARELVPGRWFGEKAWIINGDVWERPYISETQVGVLTLQYALDLRMKIWGCNIVYQKPREFSFCSLGISFAINQGFQQSAKNLSLFSSCFWVPFTPASSQVLCRKLRTWNLIGEMQDGKSFSYLKDIFSQASASKSSPFISPWT